MKHITNEYQVGLDRYRGVARLDELRFDILYPLHHRLVMNMADHLGLGVGSHDPSGRQRLGEAEGEVAGTSSQVDDGLRPFEAERRHHFIGLLPCGAVGAFEERDVLLDVLERTKVFQIDALFMQRAVDGRMQRIMSSLLLSAGAGILRNRLASVWRRGSRNTDTGVRSGAALVFVHASPDEDGTG